MNSSHQQTGTLVRAPLVAAAIPSGSASDQPTTQILPDEILPLRIKDVAQLTSVCEKTVRRWIDRKLLRSFKLGGMRAVRKGDLRAFLDQQAGETNKERP